jgi:hypothetical protein
MSPYILERYEVFLGYWGLILFAASLLLQYLFPQKIQGPRADNLKITTARYGGLLARVHGRGRVAGHVIWLEGGQIQEHSTTQRVGGFFGLFGGQKVTEFSYTSTFAVAFTDHQIAAITRLWFDGILVWDNTAETLDAVLAGVAPGTTFVGNNLRFRVYRGTADQRPDPRLAADVVADAAEAYPGTSYIVVEDWDHEETGIRLPDVEAEIVAEAEDYFNIGAFTGNSTRTDTENSSDYDPEQGLMGHLDEITGVLDVWIGANRQFLYSIDVRTLLGISDTFIRGILFNGEGQVFITGDGNIYMLDAFTGAPLQTFIGVLPIGDGGASLVHRALGIDATTGQRGAWFYKGTTLVLVRRPALAPGEVPEVAWVADSMATTAGSSLSAVSSMTADGLRRVWLSGSTMPTWRGYGWSSRLRRLSSC